MTIAAEVWMWDTHVATVATIAGAIAFEYTSDAIARGVEIAPLELPLSREVYSRGFARLNPETYNGLPGLLADSIPDSFGQALIAQWLARQGRSFDDFNPIEQLCYVGSRGMGALEYRPSTSRHDPAGDAPLDVERLVRLASAALNTKEGIQASGDLDEDDLNHILSVGTSAGGARAKAVIAWNADTKEVRSGQLEAPDEFDHWLLKFDGVSNNKDRGVADPLGYGRIEYAYSLMAADAGIEMPETYLLEEGGRAHFMVRRFDRPSGGGKLHTQTLNAIGHFDYNTPGSASYEVVAGVMRELTCPKPDFEQLVRRCVFNVVCRNQDDHTKNISFVMNPRGDWRLSPGYDITYAFEPSNRWLGQHQMWLNGKADGFLRDDFHVLGRAADVSVATVDELLDQVREAASRWDRFAEAAGVLAEHRDLDQTFRSF